MESTNNETIYSYKAQLRGSDVWKKYEVTHILVKSLITLFIIIGNFITLVVLANTRELRCRKNALVGSLAVSDLCVGINHIIYITLYYLSKPIKQRNVGSILLVTNLSVSLFHIVFIGLERFIAIVKPLQFRSLVTGKITLAMVVVCWFVPIAIFLPVHVVITKKTQLISGMYVGDRIQFTSNIIIYFYILITLSVFYKQMYTIAKDQTKKIQQIRVKFSQSDSSSVTTSSAEGNQISGRNRMRKYNQIMSTTVLK